MTRFAAADSRERRSLFADAVVAHRERGSDAARFELDGGGSDTETDVPPVEYTDRLVRLDLGDAQRAALDELLAEFPVFKVKQPETRKADGGVVYVSAIADPKHAADFVEAVFREVYGRPADYRVWVTRV